MKIHQRQVLPGLLFILLAAVAAQATAKDRIYTGWLSDLAVSGYDVVAYFTDGKPVEGDKKFSTEYDGAKWLFASQKHLDLFNEDPKRYAPQYGGYCAYAVAEGRTASADPQLWTIKDDKLYLNYNKKIQKKWETDIPGYIEAANKNWPDVIQ